MRKVDFWAREPIKVPVKATFRRKDGSKVIFYKRGINKIIKFGGEVWNGI